MPTRFRSEEEASHSICNLIQASKHIGGSRRPLWDDLGPSRRRQVAHDWDLKNDPTFEQARQSSWKAVVRILDLEREFTEMELSRAMVPSEIIQKKTELDRLRQELAREKLRLEEINGEELTAEADPAFKQEPEPHRLNQLQTERVAVLDVETENQRDNPRLPHRIAAWLRNDGAAYLKRPYKDIRVAYRAAHQDCRWTISDEVLRQAMRLLGQSERVKGQLK